MTKLTSSSRFRTALASLVLFGSLMPGLAAAMPDTRSAKHMDRCAQLMALWGRYHPALSGHHDGQVAIARLALYRCSQGRFDEANQAFERILRQGLIPFPVAPATDVALSAEDNP